jgi:uncharacterized SAM-binding protein YcdF (DUF218 family)
MFFILSKIFGFITTPSNLLVLIGLLSAGLWIFGGRRVGARLMIASLLGLAIAGFSPLGNALLLPLEQRFPPWTATQGAPDGIVVLGGAIMPEISAARGAPALNEAASRMTAIAELARRYPGAKIVFTGGSGTLFAGPAEADSVLRLFASFGIAPERVTLESRSRNTIENVRFTKQLAQPNAGERWLLVTSAYHMPRAIGVFRRQDFPVEAYPADFRTAGPADLLIFSSMLSVGLRRVDTAVHEWAGLAGYWLSGETSALFPAP